MENEIQEFADKLYKMAEEYSRLAGDSTVSDSESAQYQTISDKLYEKAAKITKAEFIRHTKEFEDFLSKMREVNNNLDTEYRKLESTKDKIRIGTEIFSIVENALKIASKVSKYALM